MTDDALLTRAGQSFLLAEPAVQVQRDRPADETSTTFIQNQDLAVHRWFRYSAGFSGAWAATEIARCCRAGRSVVLDPFAGCGTTLVAAQMRGVASIGIEAHPFVLRIARAKLKWVTEISAFESWASQILRLAKRRPSADFKSVFPLISRIYEEQAWQRLFAIADAISAAPSSEPSSHQELAWLALVAILRVCSHANTAPWQYVLPRKRKIRVLDPFEAFQAQVALMAHDMRSCQAATASPGHAEAIPGDARNCDGIENGSVDLVLTSPPYPNNYDYADATRLEMSFLGEISRWADLHESIRKHLIPSCSQHSHKEHLGLDDLLRDSIIDPIRPELTAACDELASLRAQRAGKKTYDTMVAAYFVAMSQVWKTLSRVMKAGGLVCFVVGDSAPYGVHIPVERWLAVLAEAAGFAQLRFEQTRKRNIKWKNRKHRVPLHEGRLWLQRLW